MAKRKVAHSDGMMRVLHLLPEEARRSMNRERVNDALTGLEKKERKAIELRFGLGGEDACSFEEMGERLEMTPTGAMKLFKRSCKKVLDRMRKVD